METYIEDKDLMAFFLRENITDPRGRVTLVDNDAQSITAEKIVNVSSTFKISHITNVKLDSNSLVAFVDYLYDIKNRKIIFFEEQTGSLTFDIYGGVKTIIVNDIVVDNKVNWIFSDIPRNNNMSNDNFPRISIIYISRPTQILGNFDSCEVTNNRFQVDVWTKKDYVASVDVGGYNSNLADDKLAMFLNNSIKDSLKANAFDLTSKHFRDFIPIESPRLEDFNDELNLYNSKLEFFIKSIKTN
ncbi:MAG TPA: hypothetical protein DCL21_01625 [Alphaproteobacteria bacterium]|nr:hypothetical protein [Alphaproteobacteria bacterium]